MGFWRMPLILHRILKDPIDFGWDSQRSGRRSLNIQSGIIVILNDQILTQAFLEHAIKANCNPQTSHPKSSKSFGDPSQTIGNLKAGILHHWIRSETQSGWSPPLGIASRINEIFTNAIRNHWVAPESHPISSESYASHPESLGSLRIPTVIIATLKIPIPNH